MTAPGAPVTGVALPVSTPPRPSPSHHTDSDHTTLPASAALTVGRHSRPTAMASWMVAKAAFHGGTSPAIRWPRCRGRPETSDGLPDWAGARIWVTNPLLN